MNALRCRTPCLRSLRSTREPVMQLERKAFELKELAMVRGLQRLRAEAAALRAASLLDERNKHLATAQEQRDADVQAWQETISAEQVRPEIAGLWSQVLLRA